MNNYHDESVQCHIFVTCTYVFDFSIAILMTNEIWSSVNKHTSLYALLLPLNNNTRLGIFRIINTIRIISFLSHVLRDIEYMFIFQGLLLF